MQEYDTTMSQPPELQGVLETVLYCDSFNEDKMRAFYREVIGIRQVEGVPFAYRVGTSNHVFLIFNRDETIFQDHPPAHGATGPVHSCFQAASGSYEAWMNYLHSIGDETRQ